MYVMMPDEKYQYIMETIVPDQEDSILNFKEKLLVAMRKAQHNDTELVQEDIRFFHKW
jgi:hypothetical protein